MIFMHHTITCAICCKHAIPQYTIGIMAFEMRIGQLPARCEVLNVQLQQFILQSNLPNTAAQPTAALAAAHRPSAHHQAQALRPLHN